MTFYPQYQECEVCQVAWRSFVTECWMCGRTGKVKASPGFAGAAHMNFEE